MLNYRCISSKKGVPLSTKIYYFTGTGNSLFVAKRITELLDGELISIASALENMKNISDANCIGIIFPCYLAQLKGLPLIIEDFCNLLTNTTASYVFAICTYGAYGPVNAYPTLNFLSKHLKNSGVKLSGSFAIKLPLNNLDYDHIPVPINRDHKKMFAYTEKVLEAICKRVKYNKPSKFQFLKDLFCILTRPLFILMGKYVYESLKVLAHETKESKLSYRELIKLTDKSIFVDDKCNACEICSKICPVQNIDLIDNKPVWKHNCQMCLACVEWCPQKAIHHWCIAQGKSYHHPSITISDMFNQRKKIK